MVRTREVTTKIDNIFFFFSSVGVTYFLNGPNAVASCSRGLAPTLIIGTECHWRVVGQVSDTGKRVSGGECCGGSAVLCRSSVCRQTSPESTRRSSGATTAGSTWSSGGRTGDWTSRAGPFYCTATRVTSAASGRESRCPLTRRSRTPTVSVRAVFWTPIAADRPMHKWMHSVCLSFELQ